MIYTTFYFFFWDNTLIFFSLLDGILFTILIWFPAFAIQLGKEITDASQLIINCWGIFFLGLLIARINKRRLFIPYQNLTIFDNNEKSNKNKIFICIFTFTLAVTPFLIKLNFQPDYQSFQELHFCRFKVSFFLCFNDFLSILRLIYFGIYKSIKFRNYNKKLIF